MAQDRAGDSSAPSGSVWGDFAGQVVVIQHALFETASESDRQVGKRPVDVALLNKDLAKAYQDEDALYVATGRVSMIGPDTLSKLADNLCDQSIAVSGILSAKVNADINVGDHRQADTVFVTAFNPIEDTRLKLLTAMRASLG